MEEIHDLDSAGNTLFKHFNALLKITTLGDVFILRMPDTIRDYAGILNDDPRDGLQSAESSHVFLHDQRGDLHLPVQ